MSALTLRFLMFDDGAGARLGIDAVDRILDLAATERAVFGGGEPDPGSGQLIKAGDKALDRVRGVLEKVDADPDRGRFVSVAGTRRLAPIPRPEQNVLCLGLNYASHLDEAEDVLGLPVRDNLDPALAAPAPPLTMFSKRPNTVIGPDSEIPLHAGVTDQIDYEAELAFVIGREGCNIPEEQAEQHVFGYTIINEMSARDLQVRHMQVFKGKSLDGYCPMGPVVVHRSAMPKTPAQGLKLQSRVNGELRHDTSTDLLIYDIPRALSILSQGMTLFPGDVVATGNPAGSGISFNPPKYLSAGDVVEVEIEGIGLLRNRIANR